MVKRMYFFKDSSVFEYDPRSSADRVVKGPTPIGVRFKGLDSAFASGIDAAVNWGDGFVYLFRGDEYWKYDALTDRAATPTATKIASGWPTFPAAFAAGIDAAFNSCTGKSYLKKGDEYLRYNVSEDRVDDPDPGTSAYPRKIADVNGWRGLTPSFQSGIDAATFGGNGKIYFFKGPDYVRLTFASRRVDDVDPPYPLRISPVWSGLPATVDAAVEWIHAGSATLTIRKNPSGCVHLPGGILDAALGHGFVMEATFSTTGYPSMCGCAEYRQFVRGTFTRNGVAEPFTLANASGPPTALLPRPAPGAADDNFREDGRQEGGIGRFYGHRKAAPDPKGIYHNGDQKKSDQRNGCRYNGVDTPIMTGPVGEAVSIDIDFRGVIIDTCAGGEVLAEQRWDIFCSGIL
jgi:hypothetical protein